MAKTMPVLVLLGLASACEVAGEGELDVRIHGEALIEEGIPAGVFVDGWAVRFDHFLVAVDGIEANGVADGPRYVFDLVEPSSGAGQEVTSLVVPAGRPRLAYRIGPGGPADDGNATALDAQRLGDLGAGLLVEGTATRDDRQVTFAWPFATDTRYAECEVVASVRDGGSATTQITIHADHLFYDDLESATPNVAFDLIAQADADADGHVTPQELRAQDITTSARYQVGSADITNLWDFMAAMSRTVGHIDGEGECRTG